MKNYFVFCSNIEGKIFIEELNSYKQTINILLKNCIVRKFKKNKRS